LGNVLSVDHHISFLLQASTLVASGKPAELEHLYTYLVESLNADNVEEDRLKARLSDAMMKEWTLVGIPLVVYAIMALAKAEKQRNEKKGVKAEPPSEEGLLAFPERR
jgi:hypothetical protein